MSPPPSGAAIGAIEDGVGGKGAGVGVRVGLVARQSSNLVGVVNGSNDNSHSGGNVDVDVDAEEEEHRSVAPCFSLPKAWLVQSFFAG